MLADKPVTIPLAEPTDAIVVPVLAHVPPAVVSVSRMVCPTQPVDAPVIADGNGFTVTTLVAWHPDDKV